MIPEHDPIDMDYEEALKDSQYRHAIELIVKKCEALSEDNEKLIQRLHCVKRITKRKEKDVALLKSRLDLYSDEWRTAQPETLFKGAMPSLIPATNNVVVRKKYKKREKHVAAPVPEPLAADITDEPPIQSEPFVAAAAAPPTCVQMPAPSAQAPLPSNPKPTKVAGKFAKKKRSKSEKEKDPNAPKRPANPFFQFCQERRSILMGELNSELLPGEPELSKQELTRQLANRWRLLDPAAKQVYINMYENSKLKYNEEMQSYRGGPGRTAGAAIRLARGGVGPSTMG